MNKLGNALYEIHHMDMLAAKDQWVNKIHPLVKLVLTIVFLTVTMSFPKYDLTGLLRMGIYPIVLFIVGEISLSDSIRRLRIVLPLVCFVGLFNPIFDRQVIGHIGTAPLTAGMLSMVTLMIKGIYSVLAAYLLIATTSIEKICYALRLVHIPAILVTQVLLTYRYVTVLLEEANRMTQAYSLRAPNQKGVHFKVWGTLAGQCSPYLEMNTLLIRCTQTVRLRHAVCLLKKHRDIAVRQQHLCHQNGRDMNQTQCITDFLDGCCRNQKIRRQYAVNTFDHQRHHGKHPCCQRSSTNMPDYLTVKDRIEQPHKTDERQNNPKPPDAVA